MEQVCVCNGCLEDAHCQRMAGGRCERRAGGCSGGPRPDVRACIYPDHPCYSVKCGNGQCYAIMVGDRLKAMCRPPEPPIP